MSRRLTPIVLAVLAAFLLRTEPSHADAVLERAAASVVKVEAGSAAASGFVWRDSRSVVTALHVVDGQGPISVHYVDRNGRIVASSMARVERVLATSDLVLLALDEPQRREPLPVNASPPRVKEQLDAVGFPLNIAGISNTEVKVRFGGNELRSILPPKVLAGFGAYPSTTEEILNLEGNLVPGLSGAPILDSSGRVVGVVDGGLESGAIGISWGIPARFLETLAASTVRELPGARGIAELFSADLRANVGATRNLQGGRFVKLRTRSFEELASTADDQLGLFQLAQAFSMQNFDPMQFRYDIYQDMTTGATVVLPENATLSEDGFFVTASVGDPRMSVKFHVAPVADTYAAQNLSLEFENRLTNPEQSAWVQVMLDPEWSYLQPINRFGVLVNRKAIYRNLASAYGLMTDKYFFETLATNGQTLLAVAAVNDDNGPAMAQLEAACGQGYLDPRCSQVFQSRRTWAQMVLGVQFTSFPQLQIDPAYQ
jgi:S1-C subfamily serine protease